MHVELDRVELVNWLSIAMKNIEFKESASFNDFHSCVRLSFGENQNGAGLYSIENLDQNSYLKVFGLPFNIIGEYQPKTVLVNRNFFYKIISSSSRGRIQLMLNGNDDRLLIKAEGENKLPLNSGDGYPDYMNSNLDWHRIDDIQFAQIVENMMPFVSQEMTRPAFTGIYIGENEYIAARDNIGVRHDRKENILKQSSLMINAFTLINSLSDLNYLDVAESESSLYFKSQNFEYRTRKIGEPFPYDSFRKVITRKSESVYQVNVGSRLFFEALGRVTLLVTKKYGQLRFKFQSDLLTLNFTDMEGRISSNESIPISTKKVGQLPFELVMSVDSMALCRKLFDKSEAGEIIFEFIDGKSPVFVTRSDSGYLFLASPMAKVEA